MEGMIGRIRREEEDGWDLWRYKRIRSKIENQVNHNESGRPEKKGWEQGKIEEENKKKQIFNNNNSNNNSVIILHDYNLLI